MTVAPEVTEHEYLHAVSQDPGAEATAQQARDALLGDHQHHSLSGGGKRGAGGGKREEGGRQCRDFFKRAHF